MSLTCPCGSRITYDTCCGRWHAGEAAPTAEALMRSRYTAYVLQRTDYLLATWHPSTRPPELPLDPAVTWMGLEVRRHLAAGDRATVEFVTRSRRGGGRAHRLHETSNFVRQENRWYYVDGEHARSGEG
jgi:SEC-C motif-containing protein